MSDETRLERIENKLDKIDNRISSIDITLSNQHQSLKEHMRRTELLEVAIEPIKVHVSMVHGALKLLGAFAVIAASIEGIVALLTYIRH